MDERRFAQDAHWVQEHLRPIVERDSRPFGPKNLLKQNFRAEAEAARASDDAPRGPDVRESEPVESTEAAGQPAATEG